MTDCVPSPVKPAGLVREQLCSLDAGCTEYGRYLALGATLHWVQACAGVCVPYFVTCGIVVVLGSSLCEVMLRSLLFTRIGLRLLQPPLPVAK